VSDDAVMLDVEDDVATVTLNRPGMRNALTAEVSAGIVDALEELEAHDGPDVRAVVFEGAGGSFCAGGDVNAMMELQSDAVGLEEAVRVVREATGRAVERVYEFHLPTVAKIDGAAFGAGGVLALACDLQVMSEDASMSFGFRSVGLAVDSGASYLLPRVVGTNTAKELVFTGERVEADRAAEMGLVNHAYPVDAFDERTAEFVERVASGPTVALRESKQLLNQGLESSFGQAVTNEASAQAAVFETADHTEGVEAFMEGRRPEFDGE
jgi:enoyl-CoA hydratase/carnithine racemase